MICWQQGLMPKTRQGLQSHPQRWRCHTLMRRQELVSWVMAALWLSPARPAGFARGACGWPARRCNAPCCPAGAAWGSAAPCTAPAAYLSEASACLATTQCADLLPEARPRCWHSSTADRGAHEWTKSPQVKQPLWHSASTYWSKSLSCGTQLASVALLGKAGHQRRTRRVE